MRSKLPVLFALGGLGIVALFAVQRSFDDTAALADIRIVQAPATSETTSSGPTGTNQQQANTSHDGMMSGSGSNSAPAMANMSGTAVGFTLIGGKLYLVTAKNADAVALSTSTVARGSQPSFQCDNSATETMGATANSNAVQTQFRAWELRSYGGSGALPPLSQDGQLLTALPSSEQLSCTLTNAQGK